MQSLLDLSMPATASARSSSVLLAHQSTGRYDLLTEDEDLIAISTVPLSSSNAGAGAVNSCCAWCMYYLTFPIRLALRVCCRDDHSEDQDENEERHLLLNSEVPEGLEGVVVGQRGWSANSTSGRSHRGYGPPRSNADDYFRQSSASTLDADDGTVDDGEDGDSTPTSSSSMRHGDNAQPPPLLPPSGDRWVMQRGVLVKIGSDGIAREATHSMTRRWNGGDSASGRRLRSDGGGSSRPAARTADATGGSSAVVGSNAPRTSDAAASVVDEIDSQRVPITTLDQLSTFLDRCNAYTPVRMEVDRSDFFSDPGSSPHHHHQQQQPVPFCLHVVGPLMPNEYAELLNVVEDVILDDCEEGCLLLTGLHYCDLNFSDMGAGASTSRGHGAAQSEALSSLVHNNSNGFLDVLSSLHGSPATHNSGGDSDNSTATQLHASSLRRECHSRLTVFLKNMLESCLQDIQSMQLTRCTFAPLDIGKALQLPLTDSLRHLSFSQCPLTPSHVEALLRCCRSYNGNHSGRISLSALVELQLCGSLTDDSVHDVFNYFQDDVLGKPALQSVRLPGLLVRRAREHMLVQSRPYLQVQPANM